MKTRSPAVLKWTHRISAPQTSSGNKAHVQYLLRQLRKAHLTPKWPPGHIRYMQRGQAVSGALLATNIAGGDSAVIAAVQQARSPVWRAVISLREEDALLGLHRHRGVARRRPQGCRAVSGSFGYSAGRILLRSRLPRPRAKERCQAPSRPYRPLVNHLRTAGLDAQMEFRAARRVIADVFHGPVRDKVAKSRTEARNNILAGVRAVVTAQTLLDLAANMPGRGRIAYRYMPAHVKALIDEVVSTVLADTHLAPLYRQYLDDTRTLTEVFTRQVLKSYSLSSGQMAIFVSGWPMLILKMAADPDLHRQPAAQGTPEAIPEGRLLLPLGVWVEPPILGLSRLPGATAMTRTLFSAGFCRW